MQYPYRKEKPKQQLYRSPYKKNGSKGEPKDIWELLQDPHFAATLVSLTFSLGVFFYFFWKLMHGIREDYRKQKALEAERAAKIAAGEYDEEEEIVYEEEEEAEDDDGGAAEENYASAADAAAGKKADSAAAKVSDIDEDDSSAAAHSAQQEQQSANRGLKADDKDEADTTTMKRRRGQK